MRKVRKTEITRKEMRIRIEKGNEGGKGIEREIVEER